MDSQMKQRVFTGVVTQLQDNYGMVDQDVHFQMSDVIGRYPQVGEKVLVKAIKDSAQALNWTAQTVQTLNGQKPGILGRPPHPHPHQHPQPLLKSPKIPPLIPNMQNPGKGLLQMPPHHLQPPWGAPYEGWGGGASSRKRHSEGGGAARRGGRWEDGGPWGGDGIHQKRRRWKDDEGPRKTSTPPQQSCPLFSCFPRDSVSCEGLEVRRRYPHLPLPPSLLHLQLSWTESFPPDRPLALSGPCVFRAGTPQTAEQEPVEDEPEVQDSEYSVKVILPSMPSMEELYSKCCLLDQKPEDQGSKKIAVHPSTLIKFLLLESKGNLQMVGGYWSAAEDGASPAKDPTSLIRTAMRCTLQQTGLDLMPCTQWYKMAEMRYLTELRVETVVFMMPDVWNLPQIENEDLPPKEEEPEEGEEPAPIPPVPTGLEVTPLPGSTLPVLSLASLLEPQTSKTTQEAFEVGLMAELFCEMLQRDFGLQLYRCLSCLPLLPAASKAQDGAAEAADNAAATAAATAAKEEPKKGKRRAAKEGKKKKGSEEPKEDNTEVKKEAEEVEGDGEEEKAKPEETGSVEEDTKSSENAEGLVEEEKTADSAGNHTAKENDRPWGWSPVLPRSVLLSWVFFDRKLDGSLREADLQNILMSLGLYLTPGQAMELVKKSSLSNLCQYRKLCAQWDDSELPSDVSLQGNQALLPGPAATAKSSSRRSGAKGGGGAAAEMVSYKGVQLNIPSLLLALEKATQLQRALETHVGVLQTKLVEVQLGKESQEEAAQGSEELKRRAEQAEKLNKQYERSLKENAGHMLTVIEKMQKMVDQTTSLTDSKKA
ncbi:cell cycle and apoptosis regulator protein 2 isoform X2 [Engraulis encrasicolus]|uniref:cell cycle and apoptosis regulator protein 2 isoform X2 n=1 Tax=Engraulis encrasicolus TaxID=184585 RepID=UPI002FD2D5AF